MNNNDRKKEVDKLTHDLIQNEKANREYHEEKKKEEEYLRSWRPKVLYGVVGVIIFIVVTYIFNGRGGNFLVQACRDTKCYTLKANLSAEWRAGSGTLYFSNGGSVHFECSEISGCEDDNGDVWTIKKIERQ